MTILTISVPGIMHGKGRARFSRKSGHAYTPEQTVTAENWVKTCAVDQIGMPRWTCALAMYVDVGVQVPKSWSKKKYAQAISGQIRPTTKPDASNILKLCEDALNGIAFVDDKQIFHAAITKRYVESPCAVVKLIEHMP